MRKYLFFLVGVPSLLLAEGPIMSHKDTIAQQEFENVYKDLRKVSNATGSSVTASTLSSDIAGDGLGGEGGVPLRVNVDSNTFVIVVDTITVKTGGITSTHILDGTIAAADLSSNLTLPGEVTIPNQVRFSAYNNTTDSNVTGDGTVTTVDFDTEIYDTGSNFSGDTFTAPRTGYYYLSYSLSLHDVSAPARCDAQLITSNHGYTIEINSNQGNIFMSSSVLADMDSGDTAFVQLQCNDVTKVVDILGNASNFGTSGTITTIFSGYLAN